MAAKREVSIDQVAVVFVALQMQVKILAVLSAYLNGTAFCKADFQMDCKWILLGDCWQPHVEVCSAVI